MTLAELYLTHRKKMIYKVYPYVKDYSVAEDLVQIAFMRALYTESQYDPKKGSLKGWFTKVLFSCLWNYIREQKKVPITYDIETVLESELLGYEPEPGLLPYVEEVKNPTHKAVLVSYYVFGHSPEEIFTLLGVTQDNTRKIVQRFKEVVK